MVFEWDSNKPEETNIKTWRRIQLERYIAFYPDHKPRDVIKWLKTQNPNPWPSCAPNHISKILIRLRKPSSQDEHKLTVSVFQDEIKPLSLNWDTRIPPNISVHKWRHVQLTRYVDEFPNHKPKQVMS